MAAVNNAISAGPASEFRLLPCSRRRSLLPWLAARLLGASTKQKKQSKSTKKQNSFFHSQNIVQTRILI